MKIKIHLKRCTQHLLYQPSRSSAVEGRAKHSRRRKRSRETGEKWEISQRQREKNTLDKGGCPGGKRRSKIQREKKRKDTKEMRRQKEREHKQRSFNTWLKKLSSLSQPLQPAVSTVCRRNTHWAALQISLAMQALLILHHRYCAVCLLSVTYTCTVYDSAACAQPEQGQKREQMAPGIKKKSLRDSNIWCVDVCMRRRSTEVSEEVRCLSDLGKNPNLIQTTVFFFSCKV